ncbi:MAG: cell division protein FtsQ/DivIB [Lishizhenia sp.]
MKKSLQIVIWVIFGILVITLLYLANQKWRISIANTPEIEITEEDGMSFLTESELLLKLERAKLWNENIQFDRLKISDIEKFIGDLNEVETVEVYATLGNQWSIKIKTRRPIVRILPTHNSGFYMDDKGTFMSVSKYPAEVLVATGLDDLNINDLNYQELINNDSLITIKNTDDLYRISRYVCNDSFFNAQLTQIHFDKEDGFILIPRIGNHKIIFGMGNSEENVKEKFEKLKLFYEEIIPYEGWDKYTTIDLRFDKQIVGKKN